MANKRISELNPATPLQDSDLLAVVQDTGTENETRKTTVGALRSGMGLHGFINTNGRPSNMCYRIATFSSITNSRFALSLEFCVVGLPHVQTVNGSCIIDFNGDDCNFLYSTYMSKSNIPTTSTPLFSPSESLFLVRTGTFEFELWVKPSSAMFMYEFKQYYDVTNIVLEGAANGYYADINTIQGQKFYPYTNNQVLTINSSNESQYFTPAPGYNASLGQYIVYMTIPEEYSTFVIQASRRYTVAKILPPQGMEFEDYKKILFMGNISFMAGRGTAPADANSGTYRMSYYWYSHNNQVESETFAEFILKNKVWYSVFY
jgi:hypothetical protein